jgi:hypothetical protein
MGMSASGAITSVTSVKGARSSHNAPALKITARSRPASAYTTLHRSGDRVWQHQTQPGFPQISSEGLGEDENRVGLGEYCSQYVKTGGMISASFFTFR